ncbi:hypothetical protein WSM22_12150 [Cytophagales bacterium WSM2-2]|nr:hypothetical protein WSM22_12150 [Cytophagales bacterium WSM2-2]
MKTGKSRRSIGVALIAILFTAGTVMAQRSDTSRSNHRGHKGFRAGTERGVMGIADLTADQKTKIKAQLLSFGKEALPLTNQLAEKRAHLRTLQTAATFDTNAVNATIDDISKTESQLMKKRAANQEAIRKLLTEDQRLAFDMHKGGARGHGKGFKSFRHGHRN